jgi:hypothetical protein
MIFCLAVVGSAVLLQADAWNKKTHLTINESIQVPGATLNPGKYVVKLVDSQANRHIVQFTNEREDEVISTVLAIPNQRMQPTGESEFSFYENTQGEAPALRAWFYPGDNFGQQFAYPERKAMELSRANGEKVPVAPASMTRETEVRTESTTTRTQPAAPPREADTTLRAQAQPKQEPPPPTPREGAATPPQQPRESTPPPEPKPSPRASEDLPATASSAPLLGLIGVLSLGAALGIRRLSSKRSVR